MKILVINPDEKDATSYYRAWGTFKDLRQRHGIEFVNYSNLATTCKGGVNWSHLINFDVAFFQRSLGKDSLNLLEYLKDLGIKIWYDLDDDLWNIPDSYWIKKFFDPIQLQTIENHIKQADLVTCSTEQLSKVIKEKTNKEAHVISNAWDIERFPLLPHNPEGKTIWRGSNTHKDDLRSNRETIEQIGKETKITFMGFDPIKERPLLNIKDYEFVPPLDPFHYFKWIRDNRPKQFIVLLQDSVFNQSKSNVAWLEATAAGALCFNNGVGEFKNIGFHIYTFNEDVEYNVTAIEKEQERLKDLYSLSGWNDKRAALLTELCKSRGTRSTG